MAKGHAFFTQVEVQLQINKKRDSSKSIGADLTSVLK